MNLHHLYFNHHLLAKGSSLLKEYPEYRRITQYACLCTPLAKKGETLVEVIILYVFYLLSVKFVVSIILPVISPYFLFLQVVNEGEGEGEGWGESWGRVRGGN